MIQRHVRTTQPQGPTRVDWSNPITRGLVGCSNGGNVAHGNAVSRPSRRVFREGEAFDCTGTEFIDFGPVFNNTGHATLVALCNADSETPASGAASDLISVGDRLTLRMGTGSFPRRATFYSFDGANWQEIAGADADLNQTCFFAGVHSGTRNAVFLKTSSLFAKSDTSANPRIATAQPLRVGLSAETFRSLNGGVLFAAAFRRALSDAEIKSLSDNPWQIFAPDSKSLWVPETVSAGGGTTYALGSTAGLALSPTSAAGSGAASASATTDSAALSPISATASAAAQASASVSDLTTSAPNAYAQAAAQASAVVADLALTALLATATGGASGSASAPVADLTTSAPSATANGQAQATGSTADLAASPVAATAFTTAVGTALASPANVALAAAAGSAQGAASATATVDTVSLAAAAAIATNTADAQAVAAFAALLINPATGAAYGSAQATGSLPVMTAAPLGGTATGGAVTATKARPAADISNTGWTASTGTDLYAMLNEETPDAAGYIQATTIGASALVDLGAVGYPGSAAQRLSFSGSSSTGNGIRVSLINKADTAVVRTVDQALTPTDTRYDVTLTAGEIAAITSGLLAVQLTSI